MLCFLYPITLHSSTESGFSHAILKMRFFFFHFLLIFKIKLKNEKSENQGDFIFWLETRRKYKIQEISSGIGETWQLCVFENIFSELNIPMEVLFKVILLKWYTCQRWWGSQVCHQNWIISKLTAGLMLVWALLD